MRYTELATREVRNRSGEYPHGESPNGAKAAKHSLPQEACCTKLATLKTVASLSTRAEILQLRDGWRAERKSVVFTNGCFDLIHPGHVRLLEQARSLGDVLVLGLNSDAGVRRMKGPSRPILCEQERAAMAGELESVDAVVLFDEETPRELIAALLPDVLVKGADWSHFIAGREEVEAAGGLVVALDLQPGYSTTNLVDILISQP
jgi:D-glycero-beta-D-manno-heptose 1-phosphate adenylyltransferase